MCIRDRVNAGAATIAGVAWAGIRALSKVEVRVDGGPWRAATLGPELSEATWRQWWLDWDATPGRHTPVSYTHLDVYKRQHTPRPWASNAAK